MASNSRLDFGPSSDISRHLAQGLTDSIRDKLRDRILEAIAPNINAAIDEALEGFKTTIEGYRQHDMMRDVIRVLIERK